MIWNLLEETANKTPWGSIIILAVMVVLVIGLFIWQSRSNKKKQKENEERVNSLQVGDRVKTIGGICGFVYEINNAENTFVLRTGVEGNENYIKFDKGAIYQTAPAQGNASPVEEKKEEVVPAEAPVEEVKAEEVKAEVVAPVEAPAEEVKAEEKEPAKKPAKKTATKKTTAKKTTEKADK